MRTLNVFRDGQLVGQLRDRNGDIEFEYAAVFLAGQPLAISASLPLDPPLMRGARVRAYFGNLLPEGDLREDLCRRYKLDSSDDIGLLAKIGADCAGALVILPEGEQPQSHDAPFEARYAPLEDDIEFGEYIEALMGSPAASFKGVPTRMSLAGVQSKAVIARFSGSRLYRSLGGATTHILKLGSRLDARGRALFPGVVFNEYFCSKLARAYTVSIRPVEMLPFRKFRDGPPEYVFAIERYDRQVDFEQRTVSRLHQEDLCQALGRPRTQKYEANGGVTLEEMFRLVSDPDQVVVPAIARTRLLELVLFNLVVGNRDSHAKNYSLLRTRSDGRAMLAPAYDLVCTEVYENIDRSLPQKIGKAEFADALGRNDLSLFAEQIQLRPRVVLRELAAVSNGVLKQLPRVVAGIENEPSAEQARDIVARIATIISKNAESLRRLAQ